MKYCSQCGSQQIRYDIPEGDNRPRYWCADCTTIHYQNPKIIVGAVPVWQGRILLCKRAIEPRKGYWTLPAGFMENGETMQEGAARETWEEACASVAVKDLYAMYNLPHIYQVYVFFLADMLNGEYGVGEESSDAGLFLPEEIPWDQLAFPTVSRTLKYFIEDMKTGEYPIRVQDIAPLGRKPAED